MCILCTYNLKKFFIKGECEESDFVSQVVEFPQKDKISLDSQENILQIIFFLILIILALCQILIVIYVYRKIRRLILSFYNTRNNDLAMFSL